jgi:hypothetical protein
MKPGELPKVWENGTFEAAPFFLEGKADKTARISPFTYLHTKQIYTLSLIYIISERNLLCFRMLNLSVSHIAGPVGEEKLTKKTQHIAKSV